MISGLLTWLWKSLWKILGIAEFYVGTLDGTEITGLETECSNPIIDGALVCPMSAVFISVNTSWSELECII